MKIAYSCAGEGFGHVSRLSVLLPHLEQRHEVGLFLPGTVVAFLEGRCGPRPAVRIPGIFYHQRHDRVRYGASFLALLPVLVGFPLQVLRLARLLRRGGYQAVISDFEPHLPWAARLAGLPILQLNHPGVLTRLPAQNLSGWMAGLGTRLLEGPWDKRILVSFFGGDVGPLLRPALRKRAPRSGPVVVVNLKDSYRPRALATLARMSHWQFQLFPRVGGDFDEALLDCAAVVTPAGHQVIAEALALGKPVLALPQRGQPEQRLNAEYLVSTGRGRSGSLDTLERDLLEFLALLPLLQHPKPLPPGFNLTDGTEAALAGIEAFLAQRCVS